MGRAASLETTGVGAAAREEEQEQVCFQTGSRLSLKKSLQSASGSGNLTRFVDRNLVAQRSRGHSSPIFPMDCGNQFSRKQVVQGEGYGNI